MTTRKGWLNDWEDETDERRPVSHTVENVAGAGVVTPIVRAAGDFPDMPEPACFVDDFGGSHCPECGTVYVEDGDGCPTCGETP